jgi:hypothetical protein
MAAPLDPSRTDNAAGSGASGAWPPFLRLSVPGFAWEFLRRNPDYRTDFSRDHLALDPRWGLRFPVDPALPAKQADVFWREDVAPGIVLPMIAADGEEVGPMATPPVAGSPRLAEDGLHVRLAVGLQLLFRGDARPETPTLVVLGFDKDLGLRVRAVEALERIASGRSAPRSRLTSAQRLRLARSLLALDGAQRSDNYRQIALSVFGAELVERESWRTASLRDATIRLVRAGRALMRGGYLKLLRDGL